ncbi:nitrilase/nitrile hydratase [Seminavis robusta]|uniref:Nitrilase/nitrile hydratase n=1 Tax=Seminavis robusta TaxID=568900 RepID=A0A9N8H9H6_9STRA|nr:nitrilase/nitrile hydratase [Seminavis robusta]|eukprot:Sro276_g105940.1 nitrilase/nitrile hydratase (484) ;mRNA; f:23560-25381
MKIIASAVALLSTVSAATGTTYHEDPTMHLTGWHNRNQVSPEEDTKPVHIGSIQAEPVHWNLTASIDKFCDFMVSAGAANMDLVALSEGFLSGYPWFNFFASTYDMASNSKISQLFAENSLQVGSAEMARVQECIAEAGVNVVLPINERDDKGSQAAVFNTALFIDKSGEIIGRHRKTLPSFTERFWWTQGDGTDLVVVDMPDVGRVCSLLCWESYLVLACYTLMAHGCEFLVVPTQDIGSIWESHVSDIAREGRWYVIAQGQVVAPYGEAMQRSAIAGTHTQPGGSQWYPRLLEGFKNAYGCTGSPLIANATETVNRQNLLRGSSATAAKESQKNVVDTVSWIPEPVPLDQAVEKCATYFMDGGMSIADPNGRFLVNPIHSNYMYADTVNAARSGCVHSLGPGIPEESHCEFVEVDGYNRDEEFIVLANASRGEVLASKLYQDNVGNYARTDIWKVEWDNAPQDYIFETAGNSNGNQHGNGL